MMTEGAGVIYMSTSGVDGTDDGTKVEREEEEEEGEGEEEEEEAARLCFVIGVSGVTTRMVQVGEEDRGKR